jgi:hypothetical protein
MNCKDCYVEGCTHRPFPNETECIFRQWTAKQFDWQSFRAEASKDILCAMLTDQRISETMPYKDLVKMSLECTDELIKQLKENEGK